MSTVIGDIIEFMKKKVQEQVNLLKDIIVQTLPVEQIYLFGSYAYGTPHKDSDLDFYVVLNDSVQLRDIDAAIRLRKAIAAKQEMPTDILVSKHSAFLRRKIEPSMERHIAKAGVLLYG